MNRTTYIIFVLALMLGSCRFASEKAAEEGRSLYVIHAGSLTQPVQDMARAFEQEHPGIGILTEAWGSKAGARRVIEFETPADVFLSADYMVIENMLIPEHASWYLPFATNEMAIVYTSDSRYSDRIHTGNWPDILLRDDIGYARSNPDHDPCGVRSVFTIQLAEKKYGLSGFSDRLLSKDVHNIRPKETDLIALLEVGQVDYIFLYRSVAMQHGLKYLRLPDSLSLGNPALNNWYRLASLETLGARPGETITEYGEAMVYGLTIPHRTRNSQLAEKFAAFVMDPDRGGRIMQQAGQGRVRDFDNPYAAGVPESLRKYPER